LPPARHSGIMQTAEIAAGRLANRRRNDVIARQPCGPAIVPTYPKPLKTEGPAANSLPPGPISIRAPESVNAIRLSADGANNRLSSSRSAATVARASRHPVTVPRAVMVIHTSVPAPRPAARGNQPPGRQTALLAGGKQHDREERHVRERDEHGVGRTQRGHARSRVRRKPCAISASCHSAMVIQPGTETSDPAPIQNAASAPRPMSPNGARAGCRAAPRDRTMPSRHF
jgi:hypothetical protein